jgi:hypothetical protein
VNTDFSTFLIVSFQFAQVPEQWAFVFRPGHTSRDYYRGVEEDRHYLGRLILLSKIAVETT